MNKQTNFSDKQKTAYLIGNIIFILGSILFGAFFILLFIDGSSYNHNNRAFYFAFSGATLIIIGNIIKEIAKKGLAGSGIILDTEQETKDLEPINRMKGKQLNNTLEEININKSLVQKNQVVIKIRCQNCKSLNKEKSNFCNNCGIRIS